MTGLLGPSTERRFRAAFRRQAVVTKEMAARLIGVDADTLTELTRAGLIQAVPRSAKLLGYSEAVLRSYLIAPPALPQAHNEQDALPCRSTSPRTARTSITTSSSKVVGFMEARASRRAGARKR